MIRAGLEVHLQVLVLRKRCWIIKRKSIIAKKACNAVPSSPFQQAMTWLLFLLFKEKVQMTAAG